MKTKTGILISICLLLFLSCKKNTTTVKVQEVTFTKEGTLSIYDNDKNNIKTIAIEIADNEYETQTGLMYRKSMDKNQGMFFIFEQEEPRYFYMKNTEIPLDIIYINANKKIVTIAKNTIPFSEASIPSNAPAKYVLEINAGLTDAWGIKEQDSITIKKL